MKKKSLYFFLLMTIFILFSDISCSSKKVSFSKALILLPDARSIKFYKESGTEQLSYLIKIKYPASDVVTTISRKLEGDGWIPLKDDFLNPGLSSSLVSGWNSFIDSTDKQNQYVQQWLADWKNQNGDIVRYCLQYRSIADNQNNDDLLIIGIFIPAKEVIEYFEQIKKMN